MTQHNSRISRRTALRTITGIALVGAAGCLGNGEDTDSSDNSDGSPDDRPPFDRVAVEETTLVVRLTSEADVDQVNLIRPNGELFGRREVATGVRQVSFEIGTSYQPGEYRVLAQKSD